MKHQLHIPTTVITRLLALALLGTLFTACEKFTQIDLPKTQLPAEKVYQNTGTATAVLSGLYASAATLFSSSSYSVTHYGNYLADETDAWSTNTAIQQLATAQLVPTNTYPVTFWQSAYSLIYGCNALLEGLQDNPAIPAATLAQLRGEALFLRATAQFYLSNFFGNVPIIRSTDYRLNTAAQAATSAQVLQAVIEDLTEAASLLPVDYSLYTQERIRPNSLAAKAMLARACLYAGENAKAEVAASEVIASPLYAIGTLSDTFLKNSKETILSYKPLTTLVTPEGGSYILTAKPNLLSLKNSFVQSFSPNDLRKSAWTGKLTTGGVDYPFAYKYKTKTATVLSEYSVMIRLGELYLIRAEARARLNKTEESLTDLNVTRTRAGLAKLMLPISSEQLLEQLLAERRYELFSEWGHRWFDLRRFGKLDEVIAVVKPGWKSSAALFPIPQSELNVNINLVQNPGY